MSLALSLALCMGLGTAAHGARLEGGDAASQAEADTVVDLLFAIDTSGSMSDEAQGISNSMEAVVRNLTCPRGDVWARARLLGIAGTWRGTLFDESAATYVAANGGTPLATSSEDNGPVVDDLARFNDLVDDTGRGQGYAKAVVSIGDEGTQNGEPVNQADWDAAFAANQAAVAEGFLVFSVLGNNPSFGAAEVFRAMAVGGEGGGYGFTATGGTFTQTSSPTLQQDLEEIICAAAAQPLNLSIDDGGNPVPTGGSVRYQICFDNLDNDNPVEEVRILDPLPASTRFAAASDGGGYDRTSNAIEWLIGTVAAGAPQRCVQASLIVTARPGTEIVNAVVLSSANTRDATASVVTEVIPPRQGQTPVPALGPLGLVALNGLLVGWGGWAAVRRRGRGRRREGALVSKS